MEKTVSLTMTVHEVITIYPFLKDVFVLHGFKGITDPIQFNTIARKITIEKACRMKDVDAGDFLDELNKSIRKRG